MMKFILLILSSIFFDFLDDKKICDYSHIAYYITLCYRPKT